jgi:PIN domain
MDIFIDTNILYTDPFFRSNFGQLLLKISAEKLLKIVIPKICVNELYFKIKQKAESIQYEIKTKIAELNRFANFQFETPNFNLQQFEQQIVSFYKEKEQSGTFVFIENRNSHFQECLEKSIKGFQPFFNEKKEEFRDSLIWCAIRDFSKNSTSFKQYFITNNFSDFWNIEKSSIHENLKKECSSIRVVESYKKLFEDEVTLIDVKKKNEFQSWIAKQNITEDKIRYFLDKYLWFYIVDKLDKLIKEYPVNKIADYEIGFIIPSLSEENLIIEKIDGYKIIEDFAIFEVSSKISFSGKLHYPNKERGDLSNFVTMELVAELNLTLEYDEDALMRLSNIEIKEIRPL